MKKIFTSKLMAILLVIFVNFVFISQCLTVKGDELDMTLEDLMSVKVTSVSKKPQNISDSAAAIFVITERDLMRSGATSIPEALRMVPGIHVGRIDSNKWAVTSRGFNNRFTKKLLVMIDGRAVYTPGFSGVYWEVQDLVLEDVERIEVIRGPGASLWGANAVNGVINIITKSAADTIGGMLTAGGGNIEKAFGSARYGAALGRGVYGRIYAKYFNRDEFEYKAGGDAGDNWDNFRTGFRMDAVLPGPVDFTVQGDLYKGNINQNVENLPIEVPPYSLDVEEDVDVSGGNLLARWQRTLSLSSDVTIQAYYDRTTRDDFYIYEIRNTLDLDIQHRFSPLDSHDLIWGARYRYTHDDMTERYVMEIDPDSQGDNLFSAFVQDDISLVKNKLWLILGAKFEHNDYTGYEFQPNGRILWSPHPIHRVWTAVSRAVRTPSRGEYDAHLTVGVIPPTPLIPVPRKISIDGNDDFESETLTAFEAGYRFLPDREFSLDVSIFYNDYDDLEEYVTLLDVDTGTISLVRDNQGSGSVQGLELSVGWQPLQWFKTDISYSYLDTDIAYSIVPEHQFSLRAGLDLPHDLEADIWLRYTGEVDSRQSASSGFVPYNIDAYLTLDIRLAWQVTPNLELIAVGQNLLAGGHMEFIQEAFIEPTEVPRSFYGQVRYKF